MTKTDNSLIIGMPSGSLADPKRGGNLISLLNNAGFSTSGYESGGPSRFTSVNFLFGWDGRPQEFGSQLGIQELDIAIAGDDWIKERQYELQYEYKTKIELEKVLSLKRGNVKIVGIASCPEVTDATEYIASIIKDKGLIIAVSEMPYLAVNWLRGKLSEAGLLDEHNNYSVQKYKTPPRIEKGIIVYETWGEDRVES